MKKRHIYLILAVLVTVFIFSNSAQDAGESSRASGGLLVLVQRLFPFMTDHILRKCAHFTEFFLQGLFLSLYIKNTPRGLGQGWIYTAFCGLFTACCDELLQTFSPGRSPEITDVFIDFSGAAAALLLVSAAALCLKRRE